MEYTSHTRKKGKCKTRIQIGLNAWCFIGPGLWWIVVSRDQRHPQGAGMEGELSTESNGIGLAWLCETQIKPILPPWQVVRRRRSKSVKRGKSKADWHSAFSLSSMHIALVLSLSVCLTRPRSYSSPDPTNPAVTHSAAFPPNGGGHIPPHLTSLSMWTQKVQCQEQGEKLCPHHDRCCGSEECSGCCIDITNGCTHPWASVMTRLTDEEGIKWMHPEKKKQTHTRTNGK